MPNFFLLFFMEMLVTVAVVAIRKRYPVFFFFGLPTLLLLIIVSGSWFAYLNYLYAFDVTERAGTIVVVLHPRNFGTFGPDNPPEVFVGSIISVRFESLGSYGGADYDEWRYERTAPRRLVWQDSICWIERYGSPSSPTGMFVAKDKDGRWHVFYRHSKE